MPGFVFLLSRYEEQFFSAYVVHLVFLFMALLFFLSMLFLGVFLLLLLHSQLLGLGVELAGLVCMEGSSIYGSRAVSISEAMVLAVCTVPRIRFMEN